jgi:hypothetical protein
MGLLIVERIPQKQAVYKAYPVELTSKDIEMGLRFLFQLLYNKQTKIRISIPQWIYDRNK